ncbi:MAG TPA: hypothetical protein VFS20_16185 [Longimicrobium sp.]|nr:hypothetical protein [Longimicrobium sp.]
MTDPYRQPLDRLMKLGAEPARRRVWPGYLPLGLTERHVPALIQIATDPELHAASEKDRAAWAPIHAWRALAQLDATTAVAPLMALLERQHENRWVFDEVPAVLGMLGPAALPGATLLLFDEANSETLRVAAARTLVEVAHEHPDRRDEVVAVLSKQLEDFAHQSRDLNAILVANLTELRAAEAAAVMETAFAADAVELSVIGDWEDVQVLVGLLEERTTPPTPWSPLDPDLDDEPVSGRVPDPGTHASVKARSRRKAQKQSRKRNRRK